MDGTRRTEEPIHTCKIFILKSRWNKTFGTRRRRWEDNIKTHVMEVCCVDVTYTRTLTVGAPCNPLASFYKYVSTLCSLA
jgi:hypothetical protein